MREKQTKKLAFVNMVSDFDNSSLERDNLDTSNGNINKEIHGDNYISLFPNQ